MPPKGSTSKKMVRSSERTAGKSQPEPVSTRRRSSSVAEVIAIHDSESEGSEESSVEVASKKGRRMSAPVVSRVPATSTRASRSSMGSSAPVASTSKATDNKLKIVLQDTPDEDESSSASVVSADLSSDEESTGAGKSRARNGVESRTRNSIPMCEVERAAVERMNNLSRYRQIFEPFVTPKVMGQLNNVLIEKQKRIQEGGTAARTAIEDSEERFVVERIPQPRCLSAICKMRDYQIEGFSWLVNNYYRSVNCILADEMGLGKTLQSIACVAHLALVKKLSGPYLFIVPLSVLFNWMNEFKKWCPALKVVRLHSNDKDEQLRLRKILSNPDVAQIVVTTYDTVKAGGLCHALRCIVWRSVFLDEGHRIKNEDADVTKACHALRTRFRVILTGTPVQNNLHEFGALLSFLAPNIFTDLTLFDAAFNLKVAHKPKNLGASSSNKKSAETVKEEQAAAQQIDRALLANAHYMMKPFVLRRLKSEVEQKLPPKYETKINCPMTEVQKELTRALLFKEQALISRLDSGGSAPSAEVAGLKAWSGAAEGNGSAETIDKSRLMSLLAQLRKAANHPYLFPGVEKVAVDGLPTEEIVSACGKMQVLDKLLSQLYAKGHRVVLFSQYTRTLDILSDYLDLRGYKHSRLDGSTNRVMREVRINLFNKPQSPQFIFCLSTRAGGEGVNLFTADTVILYDSDWNPQVDIQAMARVHRIGQTKIVHVYRLISAGTVEECIVQRAQRKLFLDSMVNRGSTAQAKQEAEAAEALAQAQAQELAEKEAAASGSKRKRGSVDLPEPNTRTSARGKSARLSGAAEPDADDNAPATTATAAAEGPAAEEDAEESEPSKVFSAVRFGWNSVFSVNKNASKELTDADIERIIDRTRGSKSEGTEEGEKAEETATPAEGWQENQEYSLETFDEHAPLVSIHDLRVQETVATAADADAPSAADAGTAAAGGSKKAMRRSASAASIRSSGSFEIPSDGDLLDAANGDTATGPSARPRRSISARTVDVMVEGVGVVKVSKFSLDNDDSAVSGSKSAQDRRAARQAKQQEVLYITHSGRQVAGRDFEHQDMCNECWDGGELLVCDICPMAFHPQCIGLTKIPTGFQWFCPHHQCATCMRRVSAASLLFRCECCSNAFCEDCLPAESTVQGESRRLEALGYRMSGNACYILCSLECKDFFETEVEPPTTVDAPHQMSIVQPYRPENADGDASGGDEGDRGSPTATMDDEQEEFVNTMSSLDHALSNCALDDIRERLGFSQPVAAPVAVVVPAAPVVQAPAPSVLPVVVDLTTSDNAATSSVVVDPAAAGVSNGTISAAASSSNLAAAQPPVPPVPTVTPVNSRLKVRFTCLGEIPNFHLRFEKAGPRVKSLLFKLINDIMLYQARFLPAETATAASSSSKAAADAPAPDESEDEESVNMDKVKKDAYNHKGVHTSLCVEDIGKVFLHAVGTIARAQKFELFPLAEALGISFVTPILRNLKPSTDQSTADNLAKFLVEPKFSAIKDFSRQKLEEAIAALLVLPCPQNLLIYKSGMDKLPSNALPVDNLFLITRYLECLGENCVDGNNMFFASLTAKSKGMTQLRHWPAYYPLGSMAPSQLRNQWLGPAARLFAFLRQPYLNEDRGMRQILIGVYRALYTPQGQVKPAVPTNITTLGARAPNYGGDAPHSSGDDSDVKGPGARKDQRPSQRPQPPPSAQESMFGSVSYVTPAMDSKQELVLFLRWLNTKYDAQRAPAPSAPANSLPRFPVTQIQRQGVMEKISLYLGGVLAGRNEAAVVECVRRCEYELLIKSASYADYFDLRTMCRRIADEVNLHREWGIAAVKVTSHLSMDVIEFDLNAPKDTTSWRSLITNAIRQDMIIRVEKMLRLVSKQLGITTIEDLNHKIQQYEMGLVISSTSLEEYTDKATLPKRLAGLVADFSDYKKTLPPSAFITSS